MPQITLEKGFDALPMSRSIRGRLARLGFTQPTPIQSAAIPVVSEGRDVVGIAQTGTGKTLAFGIPLLSRLESGQIGLILAPTRELALQIQNTLIHLGARTALLIGGAPMGRQISELRNNPQVVVATPGRLMDHMSQRNVDLSRVAVVVLDEADRMLDMGFAPAIQRILGATPNDRQTLLFSATMPREIAQLAERYLRRPERIEIERAGTATELVTQELVVLPKDEKCDMLYDLLDSYIGTVLVFARTRHGARKLAKSVRGRGHSAAELHSDRTLSQRKAALDGFKKGDYRVLVATDIAARGIDVKEIALVINFDVPENPEDYVHRIGRTGRAGATGKAITLATPEQRLDVRDIEKLLNKPLPVSSLSTMAMAPTPTHTPRSSTGRRRRR